VVTERQSELIRKMPSSGGCEGSEAETGKTPRGKGALQIADWRSREWKERILISRGQRDFSERCWLDEPSFHFFAQ
jgi:hypothetical protein